MKTSLRFDRIIATTISDLWFQSVYQLLKVGRKFLIDRGSYEGQYRIEYDHFVGHITRPSDNPILPIIPPGIDLPAPVDEAYVYGGEGYDRSYIEYIMTGRKAAGEAYTYGERLATMELSPHDISSLYKDSEHEIYVNLDPLNTKIVSPDVGGWCILNQIEYIIETYKKYGHRNNQLVLQIAQPTDLLLIDPPCLRHIDTRIQDNALHFYVYFRSWDLWGGLPANLAGIVALQEYMSGQIGVKLGEMIVESKGFHMYGYAEDLAKRRCMCESI